MTVLEYAALVARASGVDLAPEVPGEFRFGDTRHVISDSAKLRALGWEPRVRLSEIVAGYVDWARRQPNLADYSGQAEAQMKATGTLRQSRLAT